MSPALFEWLCTAEEMSSPAERKGGSCGAQERACTATKWETPGGGRDLGAWVPAISPCTETARGSV